MSVADSTPSVKIYVLRKTMSHPQPPFTAPFGHKPLGNIKPEYPTVRKVPRVFRAVFNGSDRDSGTLVSATFNVRLPYQFHSKKLLISVESFVYKDGSASVGKINPTFIGIAELRNPLSWYSGTKNTTGILQLIGSTEFQNAPYKEDGYTCVDSSLFDKPITIELTSNGTALAADWSCVIAIYDAGDLL